MDIQSSGEFTTPRTPEEAFAFLSDPTRFAPLLPEFVGMAIHDAKHFSVTLRVGVGSIRGEAELKMELAEEVPPRRARYRGEGVAAGSRVTLSVGFDLEPYAEGTRITWQGESALSGKLASLAGILEPMARNNTQKLIDAVRWALNYPVAQPFAVAPMEEEGPRPAPVQEPQQSAMPTPAEEAPTAEKQGASENPDAPDS